MFPSSISTRAALRFAGVVLSLFFGFGLSACASARNNDSGERSDAAAGGRETLNHDGIERSYILRLPPVMPESPDKLALVLVLHGGGGNAQKTEAKTDFSAKAQAEGFIVVYPEGTGRRAGRLTWNAKHCCGVAMRDEVDDVGFIRALLDELVARYPIDTRRIYVTGMSNGGMMAHRLGIELSDRFAAIAPVVATVFGDEQMPAHPVSALMINGALDAHVPPGGGPSGGFRRAWDGTPTRPAIEQAEFWATADHCESHITSQDPPNVTHLEYTCPDGKSVQSYLVADNGHAWPGGKTGKNSRADVPSTALNATDIVWSFFSLHRK